MRRFLAALSFFSFIPVPGVRLTPQLDGWALGFAPLVGLLIGGGLGAFAALADDATAAFANPAGLGQLLEP